MKFKTMKLSELTVDGRGHYGIGASAVEKSDELYAYLRITDIYDDGTLNKAGLKSVDDPDAEKYLLKPNDIVFARTGNSVGKSYFYDERDGSFVYAGFLIKFSLDPAKVNPRFVKYYCQSQRYKNWVASFSTGSTRGNINAQTYGDMEILTPCRAQQDFLVEILSALDDKIELNRRINANLEQQAAAIYSAMFTENDSLKTTSGVLSDIAVVTMGQSPKGDSYNEDGVGEVFYQGRAEFGFRFPTRRLFTTEPKRIAEKDDVLLSVRAPVGDINVAYERCCIGRGLASIRSKGEDSSYLLYTMFALKPKLELFNGEGTVFGSVNRDALNSTPISIPEISKIKEFETLVSPIDDLIRTNYEETRRLQTLRGALLPRLMSGEIDVSCLNI